MSGTVVGFALVYLVIGLVVFRAVVQEFARDKIKSKTLLGISVVAGLFWPLVVIAAICLAFKMSGRE